LVSGESTVVTAITAEPDQGEEYMKVSESSIKRLISTPGVADGRAIATKYRRVRCKTHGGINVHVDGDSTPWWVLLPFAHQIYSKDHKFIHPVD
jgi:hypothetical protein